MALLVALAERRRPFRVVVDSLDEAGPGGDKAEARRIAWDLLRPLAGVPCVRLVVGSRRELLSHIGDRVPVIDLDESAYADDTDTAEYVAKIISDVGAPYEHAPDLARQVADEVARRAGRCFLVARMTASALLRDRTVDTRVPGWVEQLPSDVGGAFEAYLQRLPPERHDATTALLTALAFGEGSGLSRRIWVQVAANLSGMPLTETDIDVLLAEDGSYLSHAVVDGTRYFRLYHQELTDHMRARVLGHRDLKDIQECFVDTLSALTPDRAWLRAHPYVRTHLATHAAGSGALDDLIAAASFVISAEPSTLLPALRQALRHPLLSMAVERYCYLLADGTSARVDRAALLAFVAGAHGEHELARQAEELSGSLRRLCVEPRKITPHRVVGRHDGDAYAIRSVNPNWTIKDLVLPAGGRVVLAVPPATPHVHIWFLDSPSQSTILPHPGDVVGFAVLDSGDGQTEAVTLDAQGTIRVWNVLNQTLSRTITDTGFSRLFDAGFLSDGTPIVVCGNVEHVAAVSLPAWTPLVEVDCPTPQRRRWDDPKASACLGHDKDAGLHLLMCDGVRGRVLLHPLEDRSGTVVVREQLTNPVLVDRLHRADGTLVAISEARVSMTLFDLGSRQFTATPFDGFSWQEGRFAYGSGLDPVLAAPEGKNLLLIRLNAPPQRVPVSTGGGAGLMAPVLHAGRVLLVTAGYGIRLRITDGETGNAIGSSLWGHESAICGLLLLGAENADGPDILAIGNDGTARLWPWGAHESGTRSTEDDAADPEFWAPEIDSLVPWSQDPPAVLSVSGRHVRRMRPEFLDESPGGVQTDRFPGLALGDAPDDEDRTEDPDGTLHLLSWEYTGHVVPEIYDPNTQGWPVSVPASFCVWHRLRPGADPQNTDLHWLHGVRGQVRGQLLPPTRRHPHTRFAGFDAVRGLVALLNAPDEAPDWVSLPWAIDVANDIVCSAAFTALSGATLLLTGTRSAQGHESSVAGRSIRPYNTEFEDVVDDREPHAGAATVGRVWEISTGAPHQSDGIELAPDICLLVPHHGSVGTRWIAQQGLSGATSVIDLVTQQQHSVGLSTVASTSKPLTGRLGDSEYLPGLCWADLPTGTPVLLRLGDGRYENSHAELVTVWDPRTPDTVRSLPVPAFQILWTGSAPNGEALVALSDEHGVALCHLPSCEEVWSTPLPALVTSLALLPKSGCLDLAVGTQQGVVFLRPQLSAAWRERLAVD